MVIDPRRWQSEVKPRRGKGWTPPRERVELVSPQFVWEPPGMVGTGKDDWATNPGDSYWQYDAQGNEPIPPSDEQPVLGLDGLGSVTPEDAGMWGPPYALLPPSETVQPTTEPSWRTGNPTGILAQGAGNLLQAGHDLVQQYIDPIRPLETIPGVASLTKPLGIQTPSIGDVLDFQGQQIAESYKNERRIRELLDKVTDRRKIFSYEGLTDDERNELEHLQMQQAQDVVLNHTAPAAGKVAGAVGPKFTRFFHGTGEAFDTVDPSKFAKDGLVGPAYYLTNDARVAGGILKDNGIWINGYAQNRDLGHFKIDKYEYLYNQQKQEAGYTKYHLDQARQAGNTEEAKTLEKTYSNQITHLKELRKYISGFLEDIKGKNGPAVRPVDVPPIVYEPRPLKTSDTTDSLHLLNLEEPVSLDTSLRISNQLADWGLQSGTASWYKHKATGFEVYQDLARLQKMAFGEWKNPKENVNKLLHAAGFDGIEYAGGKRIPMLDENGQPITHTALAIFPEALQKIIHAYTRVGGGQAVGVGRDDWATNPGDPYWQYDAMGNEPVGDQAAIQQAIDEYEEQKRRAAAAQAVQPVPGLNGMGEFYTYQPPVQPVEKSPYYVPDTEIRNNPNYAQYDPTGGIDPRSLYPGRPRQAVSEAAQQAEPAPESPSPTVEEQIGTVSPQSLYPGNRREIQDTSTTQPVEQGGGSKVLSRWGENVGRTVENLTDFNPPVSAQTGAELRKNSNPYLRGTDEWNAWEQSRQAQEGPIPSDKDRWFREPEFRKKPTEEHLSVAEKLRRNPNYQLTPLDLLQANREMGEMAGNAVIPNDLRPFLPAFTVGDNRLGPGEVADTMLSPSTLMPYGGVEGAATALGLGTLGKYGLGMVAMGGTKLAQPLSHYLNPAGRALEAMFDAPFKAAQKQVLSPMDRLYKVLFDDLQLQKVLQTEALAEAKKMGLKDIPPQLEWVNHLRRDPYLAARVDIDKELGPALKGLDLEGGYYRAMRQIATFRNMIEVAEAAGYTAYDKVVQQVNNIQLPTILGGDYLRAQKSVNTYEQHLKNATANNNQTQIADYTQKLADAKTVLTNVQKKVDAWRVQKTQQIYDRANKAFDMTSEFRKFSGGLSMKDAETQLAEYKQKLTPAELADIEQRLTTIYKARDTLLRDRLVQAGLWTQQQADDFKKDFPHYLPIQILQYLGQSGSYDKNGTRSVATQLIKSLTPEGTDAARLDPFTALVRAAFVAEKKAQDNEAFNAFRNIWRFSKTLQNSGAAMARMYDKNDLAALRKNDPALARKVESDMNKVNNLAARPGWSLYEGFEKGEKIAFALPEMYKDIVKSQTHSIYGNNWLDLPMRLFHQAVISRNPKFFVPAAVMDFATYGLRATGRQDLGPLALGKVYGMYARTLGDVFSGFWKGQFTGQNTGEFLKLGGGYGASGLGISEKPLTVFGKQLPSLLQPTNTSEAQAIIRNLTKNNLLVVKNAQDLRNLIVNLATFKPVETISQRLELVPRVAEYRLAREAGNDPLKAMIRGRTVTLDFHQGGTLSKMLSQFIPFFNVSMQSSRAIGQAFRDNPIAFSTTVMGYVGGLSLAADLWNHSNPEAQLAYESLNEDAKAAGPTFMLPGGVDRLGQKTWHGLTIPLREFSGFHNIARAALAKVRDEDPGDYINTAVRVVNNLSPVRANNPLDFWMNMAPVGFQTPIQMAANWDSFRGQPIVSDQSRERVGPVGRAIEGGTQGIVPAPAGEFALRDAGGGFAGTYIDAINLASGERRFAPDPALPQTWPVVGGVIGRFLRPTNGIPSQQDLRDSGPVNGWNVKDYPAQAQRSFSEWLAKDYTPYVNSLLALAPNMPHSKIGNDMDALNEARRFKRDDVYKNEAPSVLDPAKTKELQDRIYGSPSRKAVLGTSVNPPASANAAQAVQAYADAKKLGTTPDEQSRAQNAVVNRYAIEWKVEPEVVRDVIRAGQNGQKLPALGISESQMQDAMTRYFAPRTLLNPDGTPGYDIVPKNDDGTPKLDEQGKPMKPTRNVTLFREAQRLEAVKMAQELGVPVDALLERLQIRTQNINDSELQRSRDRAWDLWAEVHDPLRFPAFVKPDGTPYTTDPRTEKQLEALSTSKAIPATIDEYEKIQEIKQAKAMGELKKLTYISKQPEFKDYQRWFGEGKEMSPIQWANWTNGTYQRYKDNPTPAEADKRDYMIKFARALPRMDPRKGLAREAAFPWIELANPAWKDVLAQDSIMALADELDALASMRQERAGTNP